jgi:hypothetical protein
LNLKSELLDLKSLGLSFAATPKMVEQPPRPEFPGGPPDPIDRPPPDIKPIPPPDIPPPAGPPDIPTPNRPERGMPTA